MKGVLKALLALLIIVAGAGIGYAIATYTSVGKTSVATPPTVAVVAASAVTPTPLPTFTPNPSFAAVGGNPNAQGGQGQAGRPGQGGTPRAGGNPAGAAGTPGAGANPAGASQVAGTISSYDAGAKLLVVSVQNGNKQDVSVTNATLSKAAKISLDDISKAGSNIILAVQGEKGGDGTYAAKAITLIDSAGFVGAGGAARRNGFPGGGGAGGASGLLILSGPTISGNTISGKSFQGEDLKVNIAESTTLSKQAAATPEDLTEGKNVTITGQAAANGKIEATLVTINAA